LKKDKLIFIHIPKTGGYTLQGIFNREYGKRHICTINNNREIIKFSALSNNKKKSIDILKGHMAFGHHTSFLNPENVSYFTMLRDPISRIISNYYYILKLKTHHTHQKLIDNNYSLKEYVESGVIANTENMQVRLLSNKIDTPHGDCTPEMFSIAKENIENYFPIVGINEYFDETLLLLKEHYNWRTPYYARDNITGHGVKVKDLDIETIKTIKSYNALDIELYNWAKKRLEKQIVEKGISFEKRLISFRKKNNQVGKIINMKRKLLR
jgi:Galactose-3-O-sulfotransferase